MHKRERNIISEKELRIEEAAEKQVEKFIRKKGIKVTSRHKEQLKEVARKKIAKTKPAKVFKIGRNELCRCGSGKKYKKCCLI